MFVILHKSLQLRLCQDNFWRGHTPIGDSPNCLKFYKYRQSAIKKAKKHHAKVAELPNNSEIDAAGYVWHGQMSYINQFIVNDFSAD